MENRCSCSSSLVCFGLLMNNQDQMDDMDLLWRDSRLISTAASLQCKRRAVKAADVLVQLKSLQIFVLQNVGRRTCMTDSVGEGEASNKTSSHITTQMSCHSSDT